MKQCALVIFVALAITPFALAATRASFWQAKHAMAPVATVLYLLLVAALVVGRYRWAWVLLALLYGSVLLGWAFDSQRFRTSHLLGEVAGLATFGLFSSSAVRGRLRRPISFRSR